MYSRLCTSALMIVVTMSTLQLSNVALSNAQVDNVVYAYSTYTQTQSLDNDCGIDKSSGINCANNGPIMQGDGLASSPVVTQSGSGHGVQEPPKQELEVRTVLGDEVTVPGGESGTSIASCDPDERVTGGGSQLSHQSGSIRHFALDNSYRVSLFAPGGPQTIQAEAECAKLVDGSGHGVQEPPKRDKTFDTEVVSNTVSGTPGGSSITAEVSCPADRQVTGGGHDINPPDTVNIRIIENEPLDNGWRATIQYLEAGNPIPEVTVFAECGKLV